MGTVRVFHGFALGVVLAVNAHPFLGDLPRRQPEPETEKMRRDRMQIHRTMRLVAVQVKRHADDGDVRYNECIKQDFPPACRQQTMSQPVKGGIEQKHKSPFK